MSGHNQELLLLLLLLLGRSETKIMSQFLLPDAFLALSTPLVLLSGPDEITFFHRVILSRLNSCLGSRKRKGRETPLNLVSRADTRDRIRKAFLTVDINASQKS